MNANATIAQLYYLFIHADGTVDEREKEYGKNMIRIEELNIELFNSELEKLEQEPIDRQRLIEACISVLQKLEQKVQVRYLAWMCLIANSDGFMSREEWQLVFYFYHVKLKLSHVEIMTEQKNIKCEIAEMNKGAA